MLIITGSIAYDYIMDFPGKFSEHILPDQLHNINLSFIVNRFEKRRGGTAGNVSYSLGLLGTNNILFSTAGNDFEDYAKGFTKLGFSLEGIAIDPTTYTATGFAMTDKKDNQIWGFFYGAAEKNDKLKLKNILRVAQDDKKDHLVLVGPVGAKATLTMVHQCVELDVDYMFDPGFILTQVSTEDLEFGVKNCKFLIGNDYEINLIKERLKNWKELFTGKTIITTIGEKGAMIQHDGKEYIISSARPEKIVDPTGAGDAWRSGFLAGMERGFDMQTCGQMGSVASSFAIEKYGTQEHRFSLAAFAKRYKDNFGSKIIL
jgi:adenosine kinase